MFFNNGSTGAANAQPVQDDTAHPAVVAAAFNNGTGPSTETTRVHKFPLPPEGRDYRPTYSGGRYALPDPETGKPERYTRVTTGARTLDSTDGLDIWKTGNVVLGLKDNPELLESIDLFADPADVRRAVRKVAGQAQELAGANEASELGTAIHAWTEAVERDGLDPAEVPAQFQPYVDKYLETLAANGVSTVPGMVERIVYHPASGWVGTLDRIYQLADGTHVIGDVKTSKTLKYGYLGFSVQLATYADSAYMLSLDGSRWESMPPVSPDYAVIAHLPSNQPGVCQLVTFDLHAGREYLQLAQDVHAARAEAGRRVPNQWALPAPATDLEAKVRACTSAEELAQLWEAHSAEWTAELTELGYARLQGLSR